MPVRVATAIFSKSCSESLPIFSKSPVSTVLNGSTFASSGFALTTSRHAIEAIDQLRVDRMLDPQRAVLVEGGDALLRRHEILARGVGGRANEVEDRLFRGAVVPGGQGIAAGSRPERVRAEKRREAPARAASAPSMTRRLRSFEPEDDMTVLLVICSVVWKEEAGTSGKRAALAGRPFVISLASVARVADGRSAP